MEKLQIDTLPSGMRGMQTKMISGFGDGELRQLKNLPNNEEKTALLDMLNQRNNDIGTAWACGYGVYEVWFDNEAAYMNIGTSCD